MDADIEHRLSIVESKIEQNADKIKVLEKRQNSLDDLASAVKILAVKEENVENDVKEIKNDVKTLANRPASRWNSLVDNIIWAVAAAVIGFILAKIGF